MEVHHEAHHLQHLRCGTGWQRRILAIECARRVGLARHCDGRTRRALRLEVAPDRRREPGAPPAAVEAGRAVRELTLTRFAYTADGTLGRLGPYCTLEEEWQD